MFRCKKCLNASTRPRIEFDDNGVCNACIWAEEKKTFDWTQREKELHDLLDRHRGKSTFDCIVTVSGGKDGSYVAYNLKHKFGMNPLCLTIRPPLALDVGEENLRAFVDSGYEHLHISVNQDAMRRLDKVGFEEYGQGYYGWCIAIHTAVLRMASNLNINLIFYSEDGEIEYGGSTAHKNIAVYGADYMKRVYLNNTYEHVLSLSNLAARERYWFGFPEEKFEGVTNLEVAHWSYFEPWDPYRNYLVAKEHCGLKESSEASTGTFTNFAQNDQLLASLHYYLMYLKFGFGRATQDAGIEIRRGAMAREQAINLVALYDSQAPTSGYEKFAEYFEMSLEEFHSTLDKFANKDLFAKVDGVWQPTFTIV